MHPTGVSFSQSMQSIDIICTFGAAGLVCTIYHTNAVDCSVSSVRSLLAGNTQLFATQQSMSLCRSVLVHGGFLRVTNQKNDDTAQKKNSIPICDPTWLMWSGRGGELG
jgi:hypothetical protein